MELAERIEELIRPTVEGMGFDIVRVQVSGRESLNLQVMAEPSGGGVMSVDHCAEISRAVSAVLDVEDPIKGAYRLEISSPGLDRPLVRIGDFERFAGFEAKVELARPIDGRKRFRGRLLGVDEGNVQILVDGDEVALPHPDIHRAKLILTDDLLAASEEQRTQ